eukprot:SM000057S18410  [mRNA]  locus=s57:409757:411113:- [translate_table: standard]
MSGRRLRHVNAERALRDWQREGGERELEAAGEAFLKKLAKERKVDDSSAAEVARLRAESLAAMERVSSAVEGGLVEAKKKALIANGKRKATYGADDGAEEPDPKKHSLWAELDEDDTGDLKDQDAARGLEKVDADVEDPGEVFPEVAAIGPFLPEQEEAGPSSLEEAGDPSSSGDAERSASPPSDSNNGFVRLHDVAEQKSEAVDVKDTAGAVKKMERVEGGQDGVVDLSEYDSTVELEALGMDRLKEELQSRGLKCGGSLQERAARLFLLKSTPLDKLDKKHFAKSAGVHGKSIGKQKKEI